jgi:murein DD-endopeptidase MepM/ murein hydrolase activator NlpD
MSIEKNITRLFEEIESSKNSIKEVSSINEAAFISPVDNTSITSPFGPRWGRQHTGVDLTANSTNVKAPADGIVEVAAILNDDCGGTIKINHASGFKTGYCHMKKINVSPGQQVRQGDVIGISGGGANDVGRGRSDGPHLHFTLRKDGQLVNPMDYLNKGGINLTGPITSSSSTNSSSSTKSSEDAYNYATEKNNTQSPSKSAPEYARIAGTIKSLENINENKNLGKNTSNRYGRIVIPKDDNPKIKSAISGKINNSKFFSGCVNQLVIENNDNGTIYLQYCGISNPSLSSGDRVSIGDVLGKTDTDVEVNMFDHKWSKIPITDGNLPQSKKGTEADPEKTKSQSGPQYWDPFMAAILGAPLKVFQDKFDKEGNRTEKRYGGVADKKQVDPFVLNFLKDPLNRKKVNENIEKIKKML